MTDADDAVADVLRRSGKPVVLAANKVDDAPGEADATSLWSLGLGEPQPGQRAARPGQRRPARPVLDALPEAPGRAARRGRAGRAGWR